MDKGAEVMHIEIYTATTPTLTIMFPENVDLTLGYDHVVTISRPISEAKIMEISGDALTVTAHQIDVTFTQEQTMLLPEPKVIGQVNWLINSGGKVKRPCSTKFEIDTETNLKNEVMS